MVKTKKKANKTFLFIGIIIFFLIYSSVYSFDRYCCGHIFRQDMSVSDFITGFPACTGRSYSDILYPYAKVFGLISIYFMIEGLRGVNP